MQEEDLKLLKLFNYCSNKYLETNCDDSLSNIFNV
jgi:hypothetical protein